MASTKRYAAVMPHQKKIILWVQSPNNTWMLLAGGWMYASEALRYARAAGYHIIDKKRAMAEIEMQLEARERATNALDFAVDVTRDRVVTLKPKVH